MRRGVAAPALEARLACGAIVCESRACLSVEAWGASRWKADDASSWAEVSVTALLACTLAKFILIGSRLADITTARILAGEARHVALLRLRGADDAKVSAGAPEALAGVVEVGAVVVVRAGRARERKCGALGAVASELAGGAHCGW